MKRLFAVAALLVGLGSLVHAGAPKEQPLPPQAPYYNTQILGSTATQVAAVGTTVTISALPAFNSGGATYNFQTCFTRFIVQMSTCAAFTFQDGPVATSTTSWTIYGEGIGTTGVNTITLPEDHLGPICGQPGNPVSLSISTFTALSGAGGACGAGNAIDYEGFTTGGVGFIGNAAK